LLNTVAHLKNCFSNGSKYFSVGKLLSRFFFIGNRYQHFS
jgi:hypothetical protein